MRPGCRIFSGLPLLFELPVLIPESMEFFLLLRGQPVLTLAGLDLVLLDPVPDRRFTRFELLGQLPD